MKYFAHTRLCLTLLGSLWLGLNTAARAEPESPVTTHLKSAVISEPAPLILFEPPNDDRVTTSRGGASRPVAEKCLNDAAYATPLTALIPESGIGLTGEAHPTLFDSFVRGPNVATISGTGLGLAIVKKSVALHQGQINFESTVGKGTTFTITLPRSNGDTLIR